MLSHQALILTFMFISVVLASGVGEKGLPKFLNRRDQNFECTWSFDYASGAAQKKNHGTFNIVTGTFNVPTVTGPTGTSVSVGPGLDGFGCSPYFQSGIVIQPLSNGETIYQAMSGWNSLGVSVHNFSVSAGDEIRITINALSATSTASSFENLTKRQSKTQYLNHTVPLCLADAWWFVLRDPGNNRSLADSAYFDHISPVTFTDATAYGPDTVDYTPGGAETYCMVAGNQTLASITRDAFSMTIAKPQEHKESIHSF